MNSDSPTQADGKSTADVPEVGKKPHLLLMAIKSLGFFVYHMPPWGRAALARVLSPLLWTFSGKHRGRALSNLTAFGYSDAEALRVAKAAYLSNLLTAFETIALPRILTNPKIKIEMIQDEAGAEILQKCFKGEYPSGMILSAHSGAWEIMGAYLAMQFPKGVVTVPGRVPKDPQLWQYMVDLRKRTNIRVIDKDAMLKDYVRAIAAKKNIYYAFIADQHYKGGVKADFLGRRACTVHIPASLIHRNKMPAVICSCVRRSAYHYEIRVKHLEAEQYYELGKKEGTEAIVKAMNAQFSADIKLAPEQWTWAHRRWRECCEEA